MESIERREGEELFMYSWACVAHRARGRVLLHSRTHHT